MQDLIYIRESEKEIELCSHISISGEEVSGLLVTEEKSIPFLVKCRSCMKEWDIRKLIRIKIDFNLI
jgi:hypothetical protein